MVVRREEADGKIRDSAQQAFEKLVDVGIEWQLSPSANTTRCVCRLGGIFAPSQLNVKMASLRAFVITFCRNVSSSHANSCVCAGGCG